MLAELRMELLSDNHITGFQSSNLQGVLMEQIDSEYAGQLHNPGLNPYSQSLETQGGKTYWCVRTVNKEAYDHILMQLLKPDFEEFTINKKGIHVKIQNKELRTVTKKSLMEQFYEPKKDNKFINVQFVTPTAFKSSNQYIIYPDLQLIYQSMMNKYSAASSNISMTDEDALEQLTQNSRIVQYRLHSTTFPLEGIRIPAFAGEISIRIDGSTTMQNYAGMLFQFAEFSGIGIKTGMGMGSIRLIEWGKTNERS